MSSAQDFVNDHGLVDYQLAFRIAHGSLRVDNSELLRDSNKYLDIEATDIEARSSLSSDEGELTSNITPCASDTTLAADEQASRGNKRHFKRKAKHSMCSALSKANRPVKVSTTAHPLRSESSGKASLAAPLDDWATAEANFKRFKSTQDPPSWLLRDRNDGDESDASSNIKHAQATDNVFYDSDLESETEREQNIPHYHAKKMRKWRSLAVGNFEKMLLESIVNTDKILPGYQDIYVDEEIIRDLECATRLALERPEAFSFGVLKNNRVTGATLWGPPGTGKTLLAKNLAKNSGWNMISATTAELWQKCHGDDEKVIRALFSMGRKLHPCIIFLDEADAMLGCRKAGEKKHMRSMMNQFLLEWDGLMNGTNAPFVLLATNRPTDLDPAVRRRAPVEIPMDVPDQAARLKILRLLLKDEILQPSLTIKQLAQLTSGYTGADLKNLCVTAATLCVSEQAEAGESDSGYRILLMKHFIRAKKTVKPTEIDKVMQNEFAKFKKGKTNQAAGEDD